MKGIIEFSDIIDDAVSLEECQCLFARHVFVGFIVFDAKHDKIRFFAHSSLHHTSGNVIVPAVSSSSSIAYNIGVL